MIRTVRLVAACAALGVALVPLAALPAQSAPATGLLRLAQLSPNSAPVDIYVDSTKVVSTAPFTTVAPYRSVSAGTHTVTVRSANSTPASPALATSPFTVAAGQDYTALVLGAAGALRTSVIHDDLATPPVGKASVRLLHAAPGVPAVDVNSLAGNARLFTNVAYDTPTDYQPINGGSYDITMAKAGTAQVLWTVRGVAVKAGSAYTLAAVGGAGRALQVLPLVDAATGGAAPAGGVQTGFGGGLGTSDTGGAVLLAALAALCAAGGVVSWRSGRRVAPGAPVAR